MCRKNKRGRANPFVVSNAAKFEVFGKGDFPEVCRNGDLF